MRSKKFSPRSLEERLINAQAAERSEKSEVLLHTKKKKIRGTGETHGFQTLRHLIRRPHRWRCTQSCNGVTLFD